MATCCQLPSGRHVGPDGGHRVRARLLHPHEVRARQEERRPHHFRLQGIYYTHINTLYYDEKESVRLSRLISETTEPILKILPLLD